MAICSSCSKRSDRQDYHRKYDAHIDFSWPLIVLRSDRNLTLQIGLASPLTPYGSNYDLLLAGSVLATVPIILLFVLFQRYFVSGILVAV